MKTIALLVLAFSLPVHGQAQRTPSTADHQEVQTVKKASAPSGQTVVVQQETSNTQNYGAESHAHSYLGRLFSPENLPNIALFFAGVFGIGVAIFTLKEIGRQTAISNKTLVLAQRPRIIVRTFYFHTTQSVSGQYVPLAVMQGSLADGQFYIVNVGGTPAFIQEIVCMTHIQQGDILPGKRPYEGQTGSTEKKTLIPGQSTFYTFAHPSHLSAVDHQRLVDDKTHRFYVMGWVGYKDELGIYRITHFCRMFKVESGRFVAVDDHEYEGET